MRRRKSGKLGYLLIGALLILAMGGIIYLVLPEPEPDEHAGQVYLNDGFDMVWITPFENVPVSTLSPNDFRTVDGVPTYTGTDYFTYVGIDTSEHQWEVNWNAAAQYLDFAYVRLGYRGYTEGGLFLDPWFETNLAGASAAGLDTGVYFFSQATNVSEAIEEAEFVIDHLRGFRVNLPVIFDWEKIDEETARTTGLGELTLTDCAVAFCETIREGGYDASVYFNRNLGYYGYDLRRLTDYDFWFALPIAPPELYWPSFYYKVNIWQYSFTDTVPGIEGETDMNMMFVPVAQG